MIKFKEIFLILTIAITNCGLSQNLIEAAKMYSLENQFDYSPNFILENRITNISIKINRFSEDKTSSLYQFNKFGTPIYTRNINMYGDSVVSNYKYDSLGNLLSKTIIAKSEKYPNNYMAYNIYDWIYDNSGVLIEQYIYSIDRHNYQEMTATCCLNYKYDFNDSTVSLERNCKNAKFREAKPGYESYDFVPSTKLLLNKDGKLYPKGFVKGGSFIYRNDPDVIKLLGIEIQERDNSIHNNWSQFPGWTKLFYKSHLLQADTIRETNGETIKYSFKTDLEGIDVLQLHFDTSKTLVKVKSYCYSDSSLLYSSMVIEYFEGKIIQMENYESSQNPNRIQSHMEQISRMSQVPFNTGPTELYEKRLFEYYDNGILKKVIIYDKNGIETNSFHYEIEYEN